MDKLWMAARDQNHLTLIGTMRKGTRFRDCTGKLWTVTRRERNVVHVKARDGFETVFAPCASGLVLPTTWKGLRGMYSAMAGALVMVATLACSGAPFTEADPDEIGTTSMDPYVAALDGPADAISDQDPGTDPSETGNGAGGAAPVPESGIPEDAEPLDPWDHSESGPFEPDAGAEPVPTPEPEPEASTPVPDAEPSDPTCTYCGPPQCIVENLGFCLGGRNGTGACDDAGACFIDCDPGYTLVVRDCFTACDPTYIQRTCGDFTCDPKDPSCDTSTECEPGTPDCSFQCGAAPAMTACLVQCADSPMVGPKVCVQGSL